MPEVLSLLDFLYSDHERVASFLAQLEEVGVQKENEQKSIKEKVDRSKGGLKLGPLSADLASDLDWRKEVRLTYDPLWVNSRTLVDHVRSVQADNEPPIDLAQIRIFNGSLIAYDLSSITSMMSAESMTDFIASGISDNADHEGRSPKAKMDAKRREASVIKQFLKDLPLGIGFVLVTDDAHFWFSVKREYLSLIDLDIPLKFPIHISGTWSVLGVVDALPEDHVEGLRPVLEREIEGLFPAFVSNIMQLTGATAGLFGRPFSAYGLSPIVVYREVTSQS